MTTFARVLSRITGDPEVREGAPSPKRVLTVDEANLAGWDDEASSDGVLSNTVHLAQADILALFTVPFELVPAPASGFAVVPLSLLYMREANVTQYTLAAGFQTDPVRFDSDFRNLRNLLTDDVGHGKSIGKDTDTTGFELVASAADGAALTLSALTGDPTGGDGGISVTTLYTLLAL